MSGRWWGNPVSNTVNDTYRLGVDIGGTFTDFVLMNESSGSMENMKLPSTTAHPSQSVISGIQRFAEREKVPPENITYFVHGTTLGVNAILERKGATCGLLVTKGFRDLLNLGRSRLPDIFDFLTEKPKPLVARRHVREIDERMLHSGKVYKSLPADEVLAAVADLVADGVEAVAISFLHSYRNLQH